MSTRGIIGFVHNGTVKATYNHSDSYPQWLGRKLAEFVITIAPPASVEQLRAAVENLTLVKEGDEPTAEQREELAKWTNQHVGNQTGLEWYAVLRETQGDLNATLEAGFMIDSHGFAQDSLFCEFGYLVNLDDQRLEFYKGFIRDTEPSLGRFSTLPSTSEGYRPISLVGAYTFEEIVTQGVDAIVNQMMQAAGEDGE